jgi:hypothetical protein
MFNHLIANDGSNPFISVQISVIEWPGTTDGG